MYNALRFYIFDFNHTKCYMHGVVVASTSSWHNKIYFYTKSSQRKNSALKKPPYISINVRRAHIVILHMFAFIKQKQGTVLADTTYVSGCIFLSVLLYLLLEKYFSHSILSFVYAEKFQINSFGNTLTTGMK